MSGPFAALNAPPWNPSEELLVEIATRCRCPQVGEPARLGDVVALGIEPGEPWARIVGILNQSGGRRLIVRCWQAGDGWFPTGEVRLTSTFGATPWMTAPKYRDEALEVAS